MSAEASPQPEAGDRRRRPARVRPRPGVLADGWYSWVAPPGGPYPWTTFSTVLARLPAGLDRRILALGALRGVILALCSARWAAVAVNRYDPGWRSLLLTRAVFGRRRKLVVFQFFDHPPAPGWAGAVWRRVDRWALGRTLAVAQVLTDGELAAYPARFGIAPERFRLVRFAARTAPVGAPAPVPREHGPVLVAGRAHCDWETLFAAAADRGWDLQVVCSQADLPRVERLNAAFRAGAEIASELGQDAVDARLARAAISLVCVEESLVGAGHIRLAQATDAGAAVLASDVSGLHGYLRDGVGGALVPPGDPSALRDALEALMADPERRRALALGAFALAGAWTATDYLRALQALAARAAGDAPGMGATSPPGELSPR